MISMNTANVSVFSFVLYQEVWPVNWIMARLIDTTHQNNLKWKTKQWEEQFHFECWSRIYKRSIGLPQCEHEIVFNQIVKSHENCELSNQFYVILLFLVILFW